MAQEDATYSDKTFRNYSTSQVQEYARRRGGYPIRLIDEVIGTHVRLGGSLHSLLDLGCGPGSATRDLAKYFDHAGGLDPSAEMVKTAREIGGRSKSGPIDFVQGEAEICKDVPDNSVDLITAATSAHWFNMAEFWPTAARILKPNGTVAFFTIWRIYCHPDKTPHVEEIQRILIELEHVTLGPYQRPGNWSLMGMYPDLKMPWSISPPCSSFSESSYQRQVWNENGIPGDIGTYICGERELTLEEAENAIATISAVTRWREAHPDLAHTEHDCVMAAFAKIRDILLPYGQEKVTMVGPSVLVTVKKMKLQS